MRLLGLLIAIVLATQQPADAQVAENPYRIGILMPRSDGGFLASATIPELARLGVGGTRNLHVEWRYAGGRLERLPNLARELVEAPVDVIIAVSADAINAARSTTSRIPIVMAFAPDDPVASGIIASLAHPGGNITGVALLAAEGDVKRFEILAEAVPSARRLAVLVPRTMTLERLEQIQQAGRIKGIEVVFARATNRQEYDAAFADIRESGAAGLVIASHPPFAEDSSELASRAVAARLPIICHWREMAAEGCLFSYGPDIHQLGLRVADYVARILKGASASEMPVEQPDRFELVINLKTARTLGLTIPPTLLARADEVIE
jgi:putative ABC transport system substrate-binding protein